MNINTTLCVLLTACFHGSVATNSRMCFFCFFFHAPISALFLVRTPTQSAVQDENLDQLVSWQSSWQGSWHRWLMAGTALANFRHSLMSACVPSSWRHDTAARIKDKNRKERPSSESVYYHSFVPAGRRVKPARRSCVVVRKKEKTVTPLLNSDWCHLLCTTNWDGLRHHSSVDVVLKHTWWSQIL